MTRLQRPSVELGIPGDPFTLFYDYDQVEARKLTGLVTVEKAKWFRARIEMTFLEPLRRIWKDQEVFNKLLDAKVSPQGACSFSIAAMGIMLNVVEALGSFRCPALTDNWARFREFLSNHMREWDVTETSSGIYVPTVLWKSFRNGIAHDLRVNQVPTVDGMWGSLELRGNFNDPQRRRFERHGQLLRVCPEEFFDDLNCGVKDYFVEVCQDQSLLNSFGAKFNEVYPN